jgi:invasion protein IalB
MKNIKNKYLILALLLACNFSVQALSLSNVQALSLSNLSDLFEARNDQVSKSAAIEKESESYTTGRKIQYGSWLLQCVNGVISGNERCNLFHQIKNKNNQRIIKIELLKLANSDLDLMLFKLPLGVHLPSGAKLIVGESEYVMPFTTCLVSGCQAQIKLNLNLKQQLKKESKAIVQLLNVNQKQKINIPFSLTGYSEGYKEIK